MLSLIDYLARSWWEWMGPMLWQTSLLVVVVAAFDALVRKWAWPQVRYAVWSLVLIKLLLPPTWSLPTGIVSHLRPWLQSQVVATVAPDLAQLQPSPLATSADGTTPAATTEIGRAIPPRDAVAPAPNGLHWTSVAFGVWLLGVLIISGVLAVRIVTLRRWHREQEERDTIPKWFHELMVATAARLSLERLPAIVFSERAVTPAVYGVLRPTLLLPQGYADKLSPEEAEHVLLHELAHIRRGDLWVNGLCLILQIVYWFNPFVAWTRRQVKHIREMCCDLTIANLLRERTAAYRLTLLNAARELLSESLEPAMGLLGVFEEPFRLLPRLRWLERRTWERRRLIAVTALAVPLILAPFVLPMAAARPAQSAAMVSGDFDELRGAAGGPSPVEALGGENVYIRDATRAEVCLLGIPLAAKSLYVAETWVGDRVIANTERGRTIIVDLRKGLLTFVDHRAGTYVEASLPIDAERVVDDAIAHRFRQMGMSGEVKKLRSTRIVLGRRCRGYEVSMWTARARSDAVPRTVTVWATSDVPFDLALYQEFLENLRLLYNRDDALRSALRTITGFQARLELVEGGVAASTRTVTEAELIVHRPAPPSVYSAPEGYRKLERIQDLDF